MYLDKDQIKKQLTTEQIFSLLQQWGGEPEYTDYGIVSTTICHNPPGVGQRKLYYYENKETGGLFHCYTDCSSSFDIFELTIKVAKIQKDLSYNLFDAVKAVAFYFGLTVEKPDEDLTVNLENWKVFDKYKELDSIESKEYKVQLKEYDINLLSRFNYSLKLRPWLLEDISQEVLEKAQIGYYPGGDQITIPHFDQNNRLVGIRGRTLNAEEASLYGKYRPIKIGTTFYSHPLGMNLYNLNNIKENIEILKKAIIFEGEKSVLKYQSYFGIENDISVACCGSNISVYQINMLIENGAKEIIIALDRQFQEINDDEYKRLTTNLINLNNKYKNYVDLSFIFDKNMITNYKSSPIDEGIDKFIKLFEERVRL